MLTQIAKFCAAVLIVAVVGLCGASFWHTWHSTMQFQDKVANTTQVLTFLFIVPVSLVGGLFTLIASLKPIWLSNVGWGPKLELEWQEDDSAYVHRWDRWLDGAQSWSPAIIIRMAVWNRGAMTAESVQVVLEEIIVKEKKDEPEPETRAKFSRLLWADSYDLDEFEKVRHHRCPTGIESFIHAKSRHFVDFAFIFEPHSEFYKRSKRTIGEDSWCVHPFYQWLPAQGENAVLKPGSEYDLCVAVSAKNYGTIRYKVTVDCSGGQMPLQFPTDAPPTSAFEIVGKLGDVKSESCPVKIGVELIGRLNSM